LVLAAANAASRARRGEARGIGRGIIRSLLQENAFMLDRLCIAVAAVCGSVWTAGVVRAAEPAVRFPSPLTAEESLTHFRLDPELTIELVAAEPQVVDPVAVQFGADGTLWAVEMRDYPHGPREGEPPKSQIVRLTDEDGDGRYETARVFADRLLFCTGLLPYRDGVIVTLAGQIAFFADRDGDGRAEFRETWFSGFAQENSQLRANHPTLGLDGYVYVANGLRGGKIVAERPDWKRSDTPLVITGFDFRFHPETGDFATASGHGQFGLTLDDLGRRFVCSNRNPCQHVVLENWYLQRHPQFAAKAVMHDVCAPAEQSRLFPISQAWTTSTLHANQFTAACGVTIYRGDALPPAYYGNVFTCDPTGNLVHREILAPQGVTFRGTPPEPRREFLASPDTWFRPVNLALGPEGALYVVDMYRAVIEHPDFMPSELKTRPDLLSGADRGRIYRLVPKGGRPRAPAHPATLSQVQLVERLASANAWQAETAARLLVERHALDAAASLRSQLQRAAQAPAESALVGHRALRVLHQLGALSRDDLVLALQTEALAETACQLAEAFLSEDAELRRLVARHLESAHDRVAFQALLSLSAAPLEGATVPVIAKALLCRADDAWFRAAAIVAVREQAPALLHQVALGLADDDRPSRAAELCESLMELAVSQHPVAMVEPSLRAFAAIDGPEGVELLLAVRRGWGQGAARRGAVIARELVELPDTGATVREILQRWIEQAASLAQDPARPSAVRRSAVRTLRWADPPLAVPLLINVVQQPTDTELALAACEALAPLPGDAWSGPLLEHFPRAVPAVRRALLDVLLADPRRAQRLLDAVEQTVSGAQAKPEVSAAGNEALPAIQPAEIDPQRTGRLLNHRDAALRERAQRLLSAGAADRAAVLKDYERALQQRGDAHRGKALFGKHCVACHRIGEQGVNVGPDIGDTRDKTPQYLLTAILDPNRAVDNNYFAYAVATQDGKVRTGIIAAETATSITLKQAEGKTETILRTEIEELRATGQSFMPVGFEKNLSVEEMADLISFLKNWRYLDGSVPLETK
jgi:putative membrane-bound dehydrogenase-like protein